MDDATWRVSLSGSAQPHVDVDELRQARCHALERGVRMDVEGARVRAEFFVTASDLDHAIEHGRRRWAKASDGTVLALVRLTHFSVDEFEPPRPDAFATAQIHPRPRPRLGAACLDLPVRPG